MTILLFIVAGVMAAGTLINIAMVGKQLEPSKGWAVAIATAIRVFMIVVVVWAARR